MAPHTPEDKAAELAYVEDNIDFKAEQKVLERVEDNEAAGYVDPTLVVSESDDKRLRRTINRR